MLEALTQPPYEPLAEADDRVLSLKTAFLLAFPRPQVQGEERARLHLLCPVRAVARYLERTKAFGGSTLQLLVCYGGPLRGKKLSSGTLSHWLVKVITSAGEGEPGVRGFYACARYSWCVHLFGPAPWCLCG